MSLIKQSGSVCFDCQTLDDVDKGPWYLLTSLGFHIIKNNDKRQHKGSLKFAASLWYCIAHVASYLVQFCNFCSLSCIRLRNTKSWNENHDRRFYYIPFVADIEGMPKIICKTIQCTVKFYLYCLSIFGIF